MKTQKLARILFPVAFWSLRKQGAIALELNLDGSVGVRARGRGNIEAAGLEGAIVAELSAKPRRNLLRRDVESVVGAWFGWFGVMNPSGYVVDAAARSAGVAGFTDCDAVAAVRETFEELLRRWNQFKMSDNVLHDELTKQCTRAIGTHILGGPIWSAPD